MRKASALLCMLLLGCAEGDDIPLEDDVRALEAALGSRTETEPAGEEANAIARPFEHVVRACHERSRAAGSTPEVHAVGHYLALGDAMLIVRVSIPEAPGLARCIEQGVSIEAAPATELASDALASGSFAIDLGGAPPPVRTDDIERQFAQHERSTRELVEEIVKRGVLRADDRAVRALMNEAAPPQ